MGNLDLSKREPTSRFSDRVLDYEKFRPEYPGEIIDILIKECQIQNLVVADIGSGTGKFTKLLIAAAKQVIAVEPNLKMREVIENKFRSISNFRSIGGTAEQVSLPDSSVDMITAAQSFQWFNKSKSKEEFIRILKRGGWVVLLWNNRNIESPFEISYEELMSKYALPYPYKKKDDEFMKDIKDFYGESAFKFFELYSYQDLDYSGMKGRILSSSFIPKEESPNHKLLEKDIKSTFDHYQQSGRVRLSYKVDIYIGTIHGS